ncbi:MAG TPA: hypothetical protein VFM70_03475 [Salinimicrobium sp.]|nr:hypothetical protein [Salinimicrobium sp.]
MKNLTYEDWHQDVATKLKELKEKIDKNKESKSLYGGFYVWDGRLIMNPKIMFLGINPGNGDPNNSGQIKTDPEEEDGISYLGYMNGYPYYSNYRLAIETVESFKMAGYSTEKIKNLFEEDSTKSNFYYLITKNMGDINKCINRLENYSFKKYCHQSYEWTDNLIQIINPKFIVCEGKTVFDLVTQYDEDYKEWKWENDCGYLIRPNGQVILGYKRNFSNITNKEEFSKLISNFIK